MNECSDFRVDGIVRILDNVKKREHRGKEGVVLGISERTPYPITVAIGGLGSFCFWASELENIQEN